MKSWRLPNITKWLLLVMFFISTPLTISSDRLIVKAAAVDSTVYQQLAEEEQVTFWVILKEKANLEPAYKMSNWEARGRFVYAQLQAQANKSQARIRAILKGEQAEFTPYWIINAVLVTGDRSLIDQLASFPEVERITLSQKYDLPPEQPAEPHNTVNGVEWNIDRIRAPQVWNDFGVNGQGIVVANIDTGVEYIHEALVNQYRGNLGESFDHNYNWFDPTGLCGPTPCDNDGHGTHTMGTMIGDDGGEDQIGVAPGAKWIAAKGCEYDWCSDTSLLAAGQWILAPTDLNGEKPDPALRPHVVNNSWGGWGGNDWYMEMVQNWVAAGIFPAFAIGNSGLGCYSTGSPGDYSESYAAGATDYSDYIAWFSSRGPSSFADYKPNIAAPGVDVRSSVPGGYGWNSGTSMASPHVAGSVALMWSAAPTLIGDIAATRAILDEAAIDTVDWQCEGSPPPPDHDGDPNNVYGEGRLDVFAAVERSPRGPVGSLQGTITDSVSGLPLEGASVAVTGPYTRSRLTDVNGFYQWQYLDVGTYIMQVSKFAYLTQSLRGIEVRENEVSVQDVALELAPAYMLNGFVRDEQGATLPNAKITLLNTPLAPVLTDSDGYYVFESVPEGEYDLLAETNGCRTTETKHVLVDAARSVDFVLATRYDTFGYYCEEIAFDWVDASEELPLYWDDSFQLDLPFFFPYYGQTYRTAWVSANGFINFQDYNWNNWNEAIPNPNSPNAAVYSFWDDLSVDEYYGDRVKTTTLGSAPNRVWVLEYENVHFGNDYETTINFEAKLYERDGSVDFLYQSMPGKYGNGSSATVGIENEAGSDGLQFSYNQPLVADAKAIRFIPPPQGTIEGTVTDANDGLPIAGTTIRILQDDLEVLNLKTDQDGYYRAVRQLGDYTVEASAPNYVTQQAEVNLENEWQIITQNFVLDTAIASVEPGYLTFLLPVNQQRTMTLSLSNLGSADLVWDVKEAGGSKISTPAQQGLTRNPDFDANATTTQNMFTNGRVSGWSPSSPGDVIRTWTPDGMNFPWGVGYNGNIWLSDVATSFFDNCGYYGECNNKEFTDTGEPTGQDWLAPWAGSWPGDMAYDADRNLMCQVNVGGDNGIYCWDPNTGDVVDSITGSFPWTNTSQRGLAYRPDDDSFYIGGWNEGVIYHIKGLSYPDKGAVINQCYPPDYTISGLAWNPTFKVLWEATNSESDTIYQLNPNTCEVVATLAHPNPYYNGAGLEMDFEGNLWMISQSQRSVYLLDSGVPAFVDVSWISESPASGTLPTGASQSIQVTVDTIGLEPGVYSTIVFLRSNSAKDPMIRIPVSLVIPAYMTLANTGGEQYTDTQGEVWAADQMYAAGSWGYVNRSQTFSTKKAIAGTEDEKLFQDMRQDVLEYRFDGLPNGVYQVVLHFAELKPTKPNARLFDVIIEGQIMLYAHDIALEVGSFTAETHIFYVSVTDRQLNVRFLPRRGYGQPIINAISVIHRPDR